MIGPQEQAGDLVLDEGRNIISSRSPRSSSQSVVCFELRKHIRATAQRQKKGRGCGEETRDMRVDQEPGLVG